MSEDFKRFARKSGERARVKAARVAVILRMYRRDPVANAFLRSEAEQLARKVVYHLRQAVIVGSHIDMVQRRNRRPTNLIDT
jgi:hypothetical protein